MKFCKFCNKTIRSLDIRRITCGSTKCRVKRRTETDSSFYRAKYRDNKVDTERIAYFKRFKRTTIVEKVKNDTQIRIH